MWLAQEELEERMEEVSTSDIIRTNIKYYRIKQNITQEEMADYLYISPKHYSHLENGDFLFSLDKVDLICKKLNVDFARLSTEVHSLDEIPKRASRKKGTKE